MLLRRITRHINEQNWFAIGVDFVIVIVGVFIGIQVANWNEARVAAAAEAQLMVRLADEMQAIEAELAGDAANYALTVDATGELLSMLRTGTPPVDESSFRRALWQSNHYYEIPSLSASYAELVASGGLSRTSDHELRAALTRYGDHYERYNRLYGVAISTILDPDSVYIQAVAWSVDPTTWNDPEAAIVSYDWTALLGAKGELQTWLAFQSDGGRNIRTMHEEVRRIVALTKE